ncbi:MAG TPA: hypothetical protein EYG78_06640 [Sulfurovum sp.]|nr:hypothetical protein [Sulfurovum sp.]
MKRILLVLVCVANLGMAETTSLDISISDMKEAIYRLIKDINELKAVEGSKTRKEIERLKRKVAKLEKQQHQMMANQKTIGNGNNKKSPFDSFIDAFVSKNSDALTK